ncbi:MAG: polysulfide reductase NrfD [Anaerolineales bacterium]
MLKKIVYALGAIALLVGLWGFYDRLAFGEAHVSYGSVVVWGLWVAMYFFFGGIAVGSFFVAALEYLFDLEAFKGYGKPALWTSLVTLAVGMMSIAFDLGHMERIWKAFFQFNARSGVVEDVWGYTIFGILALVALILAIRNPQSKALKPVMLIGFIVAAFVMGTPGKLLGNNATRLYWYTALLPVQFVFMALLTAAAMTMLIKAFISLDSGNGKAENVLRISAIVLLVISLYFTWFYFSQATYAGHSALVDSITQVTSGQYAVLFWGVQIVLGAIIPLIVLSLPNLAASRLVSGFAALFILIGNAVARYLIVVPGQTVSVMKGIEVANSGPGLSLSYSPSPVEWAVTAGTVGIVLLALALGADFLPLYSKKAEA